MNTDAIDYRAVLADLEKKREDLDAAIAVIRVLLGEETTEGTARGSGGSGRGDSAPDLKGAFLGMSIAEAAKQYLAMVKMAQTAPQIAKALEAGGIFSDSKNFPGTVYATLRRIESSTGVVKQIQGSKWGLSEWRPGQPKTKEETPGSSKPKKVGRKRRAKAKGRAKAAPQRPRASVPTAPAPPSEQSESAA